MNHYTEPYSYEAQYLNQGIQERNEARNRNNQRYPTHQSNGRTQPVSRQKETEALAMLNDFQRQMNGGQSDPLNLFGEGAANFMRTTRREKSLFQGNPRQDYQPQPNYQRSSPRHPTLNNQKQGNEPQPSVGFNQGFGHQSPFVNAANMMMSPTAQYPMPMQTYDPYGMNMMGGSPLLERKKEPSKAAEIIMAGIEKQNLILAELTGSIHRDRENKMFQESKEIEYRIKQLEFENQGKPSSLFNAGMDGYNRPMLENGVQKYNSLLPGIAPNVMSPAQMMQLAALMQHQRFMPQYGPQFGGMNADMFKHQMKFLKKHEKQVKKEKERKKKSKLKDLLKLLGEDGSGSDDSDDDKDEIVTSKKKGSDDRRGSGSPSRKDAEDKKAVAAERAQLEKDKKKQAEDQLKRKKKFKVQGILWARFYPALYWNDFKKRKMGDREEIYSTLSQRIGVNIDNARNWATKATAKGFEALVSNNKLNVALVPYGGKKLNPKDLDPRPAEIQRILKIFMDGLINNTKREIVPSQLLGFLGDITQNYKYPPQNYLFAFEVNRLLFTHNASLKDMTQARVQMICSFFIFIRVFIAEMLLQADKVVPSVKMTDIFVRNIKTFASILVIIMVEYLRSKAVIVSGNQNHLDVDLKIKARSAAIPWNPPMDLKDDPADSEEGASTSKKQDPTEIVISNLYTKEDLSAYFSKKPLVDEIKALCEGWCNAIFEVVNSHYQDELKEKKSKNKK